MILLFKKYLSISTTLLVGSLLLNSQAFGMSKKEQKFVNKHMVPSELKEILDKHREELNKDFTRKCTFTIIAGENGYIRREETNVLDHKIMNYKWLESHYLKTEVSRLYDAYHLNKVIKHYGYDKEMEVTPKYIYPLTNNPNQLENDFLVVSKKVEKRKKPIFDLNLTKKMYTIMQEGYYDTHKGNFLLDKNGKLHFVDTEARGFDMNYCALGNSMNFNNYKNFKRHFPMKTALKTFEYCHHFTPEAKEYLQHKIVMHEKYPWIDFVMRNLPHAARKIKRVNFNMPWVFQ